MPQLELKKFLDSLFERYHRHEYLSSDPLEFVHLFTDPWDREAVALIAAMLAYGNVKKIRKSITDVLCRIEESSERSPARFVRSVGAGLADTRVFQDFVHRFNSGHDILILLGLLAKSWKEYGSLGAHLTRYLEPKHCDTGMALGCLIGDWRQWAGAFAQTPVSFFLTSPLAGSCCKRWCMLLRWMGRRDELDPGLWTRHGELEHTLPKGKWLRPEQLVIPIDTHTGRISQYLGLTARKSSNWAMALEVTESLRECDPKDPTKYDFALARLGILDLCQKRFNKAICLGCQLLPVCKLNPPEPHP